MAKMAVRNQASIVEADDERDDVACLHRRRATGKEADREWRRTKATTRRAMR